MREQQQKKIQFLSSIDIQKGIIEKFFTLASCFLHNFGSGKKGTKQMLNRKIIKMHDANEKSKEKWEHNKQRKFGMMNSGLINLWMKTKQLRVVHHDDDGDDEDEGQKKIFLCTILKKNNDKVFF